jgi:hypothetical protein
MNRRSPATWSIALLRLVPEVNHPDFMPTVAASTPTMTITTINSVRVKPPQERRRPNRLPVLPGVLLRTFMFVPVLLPLLTLMVIGRNHQHFSTNKRQVKARAKVEVRTKAKVERRTKTRFFYVDLFSQPLPQYFPQPCICSYLYFSLNLCLSPYLYLLLLLPLPAFVLTSTCFCPYLSFSLYRNRLYLSIVKSALTPSFHVIFLPSL